MKRLALLGLIACHAPAQVTRVPLARASLSTHGDVVAVAEQGGTLYLFTKDRATIERDGTALQAVPPPSGAWADAATIPALDGEGAWVVARTTTGELWRITASGDTESIHDRLGLPARVRSIAAAGGTVGIALDDGVAVLEDTSHIARYPGESGEVIAAHGRLAIRNGGHLSVWDLAHATRVEYVVPDTVAAGFIAGRLVVAARDAVFLEERDGLRRLAAPDAIRAAAVGPARVWIATVRGIYQLVDHTFVPTEGPPADRLFGLADGDLLASSRAGITRLSIDRASGDALWDAQVKPIFQRVCAKCHLPGGDAGVDLSSPIAWRAEHGELVHRVLETRTMPPAGTSLSDAERTALAAYLGGGAAHH